MVLRPDTSITADPRTSSQQIAFFVSKRMLHHTFYLFVVTYLWLPVALVKTFLFCQNYIGIYSFYTFFNFIKLVFAIWLC